SQGYAAGGCRPGSAAAVHGYFALKGLRQCSATLCCPRRGRLPDRRPLGGDAAHARGSGDVDHRDACAFRPGRHHAPRGSWVAPDRRELGAFLTRRQEPCRSTQGVLCACRTRLRLPAADHRWRCTVVDDLLFTPSSPFDVSAGASGALSRWTCTTPRAPRQLAGARPIDRTWG